eukprot:c5948_g1_i6.p2 GENE.c5948_g1_i6~~c5948_g1_i6.p2  ORF type:complete len:117 (+),score=17.36 c5948_g1_i6:575-925(+)
MVADDLAQDPDPEVLFERVEDVLDLCRLEGHVLQGVLLPHVEDHLHHEGVHHLHADGHRPQNDRLLLLDHPSRDGLCHPSEVQFLIAINKSVLLNDISFDLLHQTQARSPRIRRAN